MDSWFQRLPAYRDGTGRHRSRPSWWLSEKLRNLIVNGNQGRENRKWRTGSGGGTPHTPPLQTAPPTRDQEFKNLVIWEHSLSNLHTLKKKKTNPFSLYRFIHARVVKDRQMEKGNSACSYSRPCKCGHC